MPKRKIVQSYCILAMSNMLAFLLFLPLCWALSCKNHPEWADVFHNYLCLPFEAYSLRIKEWGEFCSQLQNVTSLSKQQLAEQWANFTTFYPVTTCDLKKSSALVSIQTTAGEKGNDFRSFRLCVDIASLLGMMVCLGFVIVEKYGRRIASRPSHV